MLIINIILKIKSINQVLSNIIHNLEHQYTKDNLLMKCIHHNNQSLYHIRIWNLILYLINLYSLNHRYILLLILSNIIRYQNLLELFHLNYYKLNELLLMMSYFLHNLELIHWNYYLLHRSTLSIEDRKCMLEYFQISLNHLIKDIIKIKDYKYPLIMIQWIKHCWCIRTLNIRTNQKLMTFRFLDQSCLDQVE